MVREDRLRHLFLDMANYFAQALIVEKEEAEGPTRSGLSFEEKAHVAASMLLEALRLEEVEIIGFRDDHVDADYQERFKWDRAMVGYDPVKDKAFCIAIAKKLWPLLLGCTTRFLRTHHRRDMARSGRSALVEHIAKR